MQYDSYTHRAYSFADTVSFLEKICLQFSYTYHDEWCYNIIGLLILQCLMTGEKLYIEIHMHLYFVFHQNLENAKTNSKYWLDNSEILSTGKRIPTWSHTVKVRRNV